MMAGIYNRFASRFYSLVEKVKGRSTLNYIPTQKNLVEDLTAYSIAEYEIRIFCHQERFRRKYDHWYIPSEIMISYRVYGVVTNNAPDNLRDVCEFDVRVGIEHSKFIWDYDSKQIAIKTYLDVLIERLELPKHQ